MVLNVHGGPNARDNWGYRADTQWLANRGYATINVNYRGSTGFGKDFINAGDGEWARKMQDDLELVASRILPDEKISTIAYGCTSGTIAIGEDKVRDKILLAKPGCYVTTPVTSAVKAFKKMNINKIALFTPYPDAVNKTILEYFSQKNIEVLSFASFNLNLDSEIANVDPNYILEISSKLEMKNVDALFISCTALPVLNILNKLENKLKKLVLSSNQTLIWDTIRSTGYKFPIEGYGKLLEK